LVTSKHERVRSVDVEPRLRFSVLPGSNSGSSVRDALDELVTEADPVAREQIAVLVGALTSEDGEQGERSSPIDLRLWVDPSLVRVELRDRDFSLHRSEGGLVDVERSMVSNWRLKLVERLAARWSVTHDQELILRFEFDGDSPGHAKPPLTQSGETNGGLPLEEQMHPPIGGWGSISENGRSADRRTRSTGAH
jgi:hypothetical protein